MAAPVDWEDAVSKIQTLFNTGWGTTTPIAWDNVDYRPGIVSWVRFFVMEDESNQMDMGSTLLRYRNGGMAVIYIFVPQNTGTQAAKGLADTASAIFRGVTSDEIIFRAPSIKTIGISGAWYQINVLVPYEWDLIA